MSRDDHIRIVADASRFVDSMRQAGDLAVQVLRRAQELQAAWRVRDPMSGPGHHWSSDSWSARHEGTRHDH